jgi:hypothetical protein
MRLVLITSVLAALFCSAPASACCMPPTGLSLVADDGIDIVVFKTDGTDLTPAQSEQAAKVLQQIADRCSTDTDKIACLLAAVTVGVKNHIFGDHIGIAVTVPRAPAAAEQSP